MEKYQQQPDKKLEGLKAVIVFRHVRVEEERHRLARFLMSRGAKLVSLIEHPLSTHAKRKASVLTTWNKSGENKKAVIPRLHRLGFLSYIMDTLITLYFILQSRQKYDIYFGINWPDTLPGIILRKMGIIKQVVLWTTEFFPERFKSNLFNWIYRQIDCFCIAQADYVWNSTQAMIEARQRHGYQLNSRSKQIVVPYFIDGNVIEKSPMPQLELNSVIYTGILRTAFEFKLLIEIISEVKKRMPSIKLTITSWEYFLEEWKKEIAERDLKNNIEVLGYIEDWAKFQELLKRHCIGLALYREGSFFHYSDPAKLKDYLAKGLPVVTTRVAPMTWEIERGKAGIAVNYDKHKFAEAIVKLLSDQNLYEEYRENALRVVFKYTTKLVLQNAFQKMNYTL